MGQGTILTGGLGGDVPIKQPAENVKCPLGPNRKKIKESLQVSSGPCQLPPIICPPELFMTSTRHGRSKNSMSRQKPAPLDFTRTISRGFGLTVCPQIDLDLATEGLSPTGGCECHFSRDDRAYLGRRIDMPGPAGSSAGRRYRRRYRRFQFHRNYQPPPSFRAETRDLPRRGCGDTRTKANRIVNKPESTSVIRVIEIDNGLLQGGAVGSYISSASSC